MWGGLCRGMFSISSSSFSHIVCFSSIPGKYNLLPIDIHSPRAGYPNANSVTFSECCIHRIILSTWVSSVSLASPPFDTGNYREVQSSSLSRTASLLVLC